MCIYTNYRRIHEHLLYTRLVILTFVIVCLPQRVTSGADGNNISASQGPLVRFSDVNAPRGNYSGVLKELCANTDFGVIHTYRYYRNTGQIVDGKEPPQTQKAKQLLRGLSKISWSAMWDEMDSKTRLANLEQLVRLEEHLLKAKPLGAGNIQLAHSVSILISALIFQEVAESEPANLDKVVPFLQRDILKKYYTPQALKEIFEREMNYYPTKTFNSQYDLLIGMLFDKCPEFAKQNENKESVNLGSMMKYKLSSHKREPGKSMNPLIDVDPLDFVSDFFVVRNVELCVRFSVLYRKLKENADDKMKPYLLFNQALINGMTDFEKQISGNPKDAKSVSDMTRQISGQIRDNLDTRGRNILEILYRRFLLLSKDNDLPELDK